MPNLNRTRTPSFCDVFNNSCVGNLYPLILLSASVPFIFGALKLISLRVYLRTSTELSSEDVWSRCSASPRGFCRCVLSRRSTRQDVSSTTAECISTTQFISTAQGWIPTASTIHPSRPARRSFPKFSSTKQDADRARWLSRLYSSFQTRPTEVQRSMGCFALSSCLRGLHSGLWNSVEWLQQDTWFPRRRNIWRIQHCWLVNKHNYSIVSKDHLVSGSD